MSNLIDLPDKVVEEDKDTATPQKTNRCWDWEELVPLDSTTRNGPPSFEKEEGILIVLTEEEQLAGHYYSWIEPPSGEIFRVGGADELGSGAAVDSNAVFSGGLIIKKQMPATRFNIWPVAREPRGLTQDLEQPMWAKGRQVLSAFASYAEEILKRKGITINETRIRNWQAIDDTDWKQCILDITVKADSHIALRVWDELAEELQKFINTQPEVIRPFLEDKLSLDIKWV